MVRAVKLSAVALLIAASFPGAAGLAFAQPYYLPDAASSRVVTVRPIGNAKAAATPKPRSPS